MLCAERGNATTFASSTEPYCTVLYSTVQYCTVLYLSVLCCYLPLPKVFLQSPVRPPWLFESLLGLLSPSAHTCSSSCSRTCHGRDPTKGPRRHDVSSICCRLSIGLADSEQLDASASCSEQQLQGPERSEFKCQNPKALPPRRRVARQGQSSKAFKGLGSGFSRAQSGQSSSAQTLTTCPLRRRGPRQGQSSRAAWIYSARAQAGNPHLREGGAHGRVRVPAALDERGQGPRHARGHLGAQFPDTAKGHHKENNNGIRKLLQQEAHKEPHRTSLRHRAPVESCRECPLSHKGPEERYRENALEQR